MSPTNTAEAAVRAPSDAPSGTPVQKPPQSRPPAAPTTLTPLQRLAAVCDGVRAIAERSGRKDLAGRLDQARAALADTEVSVVVIGEFKQGKSTLVNALVGAPVCPVDDVIATSVPTVVRWGERPGAALITEFADEGQTIRTEVDPGRLREYVTERASEAGLVGELHAEVVLPRPLLSDGLVLVDTPGAGRARARISTNLALLPQADAALMVTDATQELTDPELSFLSRAAALCPRVTQVISKTDLHHDWRGIVEADRAHLAAAGLEVPVRVTSALLHDLAVSENDPELRREARVDELATHLRTEVRGQVLADRRGAIAAEISAVCDLLGMAHRAELEVLGRPENGAVVVQSLQEAEASAEQLTRRSSRWQQTLSDGSADLLSDIEFDLRDRLREVGREAEQLIDASDPGKAWEDIGTWLADAITQAVSDNFIWTHQRSLHLAEAVARHFTLDGKGALPELSLAGTEQALRSVGDLDFVQSGRLSIGQKIMIGMKGSYGGVLMFGLMTTLAGMALVNPISVAAGLIMGGFAYRQDAAQRLEQRRAEAKAAVRRLVDEASFQVGKESRDRVGRIKRTLRDHFITVAEELKRSLAESISAARQGASLPPPEQSEQATRISAELNRISALQAEAERHTSGRSRHGADLR